MLRMATASPSLSASTSLGSTRESTHPITRSAGLVGEGEAFERSAGGERSVPLDELGWVDVFKFGNKVRHFLYLFVAWW